MSHKSTVTSLALLFLFLLAPIKIFLSSPLLMMVLTISVFLIARGLSTGTSAMWEPLFTMEVKLFSFTMQTQTKYISFKSLALCLLWMLIN